VQLPALGNIYATLSSQGEATAKDVNADSVKRIYIRLLPSVSFKTKVTTRTKLTNFETVTESGSDTPDSDNTGNGDDNGDNGGTGSNPL